MKINLGKTKVIIIGGITKDNMSEGKVDPCLVCILRITANAVLCVQCGKWIHCGCAEVTMVTPKFSRDFLCRKCEGNIGEAVEQEEKLCDEVGTVRESTYIGDRMSAGVGCEAAISGRTRCGCVASMECCELLYGRRFHLQLRGSVYMSYVGPAILYGSDAWHLKESEIGMS